jgi:short-subunit dehydrogenase
MDWKGRVVFLTGASSGIGGELARTLGAKGARIALAARRKDKLDEVAESVRKAGGEALVLPVDVGDRVAVETAVAAAQTTFGPIQTLIANAGIGLPTPARCLDVDRVEEMFRVNFLGAVYATGAVLPAMLEAKGGHIVGVSSLAAWRGMPLTSTYSATKAALSAWLEGLRIELAPKRIQVTAVHPGFIRTPMTANNDFPMPFLMDADRAAAVIIGGIEAGRSEINFPLPMNVAMRLARHLPNVVYDSLIGRAR